MSSAIRNGTFVTAVLALGACKTTESARPNEVAVASPRPAKESGAQQSEGPKQPQISTKAKLLFEDAVKSYDAQKKTKSFDYPSLEKKFRAAADADSNLAEAEFNMGVLSEKQGKTADAISHYKSALANRPTLRQAAENLAVIAQNSGDEKTAVQIYEDLQKNYPDDASSRARLAEVYRRRGESDKALEMSREALFRDPKTIQAYKTMMQIHYDQKQYAMAKLIGLRAAKIDDADPEVAYILGLVALQEKEVPKARTQFKKSIALRSDFLPSHYQLVKMAFVQEDYRGAEEHLRRILQADGKNPEALVNLGVAYKGMGQLDRAMATYDEAQKIKPDMPELDLNRGIVIAAKGDPDRALALFRSYIQKKGGETALGMDHAVLGLIAEQEGALKQREEDKKIAEEAKKVEEEAKKQEDAAAAEARGKKEEEFKKQQSTAKGADKKAPPPPKDETPAIEKKPVEKSPVSEPKKMAPAQAPAPKKGASGDEPVDGL
jgi:tetratricopeptide (TPR) repeat protein